MRMEGGRREEGGGKRDMINVPERGIYDTDSDSVAL